MPLHIKENINPPPIIIAPNKKPSPPKVAAQFVGFAKTHFHQYFFPFVGVKKKYNPLEDCLGGFLIGGSSAIYFLIYHNQSDK